MTSSTRPSSLFVMPKPKTAFSFEMQQLRQWKHSYFGEAGRAASRTSTSSYGNYWQYDRRLPSSVLPCVFLIHKIQSMPQRNKVFHCAAQKRESEIDCSTHTHTHTHRVLVPTETDGGMGASESVDDSDAQPRYVISADKEK